MPRNSSKRRRQLTALTLAAVAAASAPIAGAQTTPTADSASRGPGGAIYDASSPYSPLTSGQRASQIGDLLTIVLVERTQGSVTNSGGIDRDSSIGISPPATGPLSILSATDIGASGNANFAGSGQSAQANQLSGEISVRVVGVEPNGNLHIAGEKRIRINRGDETIRVTGVVRPIDISNDNRVLSIRIAEPEIEYSGRGEIARGSRQGWLTRFFTRISPF